MAPDQTPGEYAPLTCILPDCREPLAVRWELYAPLVVGELAPDADPLTPGDAVAGDWEVRCLSGHVILVPNVAGCDDQDPECMAGDCHHGDDLAEWRRPDVDRLAALLRSAGVLPAAEPVEPTEPDPFDHTLTVVPDGIHLLHPQGETTAEQCPVLEEVRIARKDGTLPPDGAYRVGVGELGDRLLIGDRIGGTDA